MALLDFLVGPVMDIVNKLIPDPAAKAQAQLQLLQLQQSEEFKEIDAAIQTAKLQTDTNAIEASNSNLFVAGWRPFVGWICGLGLFYQVFGLQLLAWICALNHWPVPQSADVGTLITMLGGMLGLGAMRTVEKTKGINSGH